MRRRELAKLLAWGTVLASPVRARAAGSARREPFVTLVSPVKASGGDAGVELLLFFSYACPHCHAWEPALQQWARQLPASARLRRVPVPFLVNGGSLQRLYYTLQALGRLDALHARVFATLHESEQPFFEPREMAQSLFSESERPGFLATFQSAAVTAKVREATALLAAYTVDQVPMLAVQGRYLTSPALAGGGREALRVADTLIAKAGAGRGS